MTNAPATNSSASHHGTSEERLERPVTAPTTRMMAARRKNTNGASVMRKNQRFARVDGGGPDTVLDGGGDVSSNIMRAAQAMRPVSSATNVTTIDITIAGRERGFTSPIRSS